MKKNFVILLLGLAMLALFISVAWAASGTANPDNVLEGMKRIVDAKTTIILGYARRLFMSLASLSLIIGLSGMLLSGESNLGSVFAHLAKWIIYVGFFMWVMDGSTFFIPHLITDSFEALAHKIAGDEIMPGEILVQGIQIYSKLMKAANSLGWEEYIVAGLSGIVIILVYGMLAATLAVTFIEMYLVICVGSILLGFAGIDFTKDIAMSYLKYAVSVGAKIVTIALIAVVAKDMSTNWAENLATIEDGEFFSVLGYLIGGSVALMLSARMIPGVAQGIIGGASVASGGGLMGTAASAAMTPLKMIRAGATGVSNTKSAMNKANEEGKTGTIRGAIASGVSAGRKAKSEGQGVVKSVAKGIGAAAKAKPLETLGAGAKYAATSAVFGTNSRQATSLLLRKDSGGGDNGNGASNYVDPPE